MVGLTIDSNGMPQDVHVVKGVNANFDEKAVAAVQQFRFRPAIYQGKPVAIKINIEVGAREVGGNPDPYSASKP